MLSLLLALAIPSCSWPAHTWPAAWPLRLVSNLILFYTSECALAEVAELMRVQGFLAKLQKALRVGGMFNGICMRTAAVPDGLEDCGVLQHRVVGAHTSCGLP